MKRRREINPERKEAGDAENGEPEFKNADGAKKELLLKYGDIIGKDAIFQKIISSIESGWDGLSEKNKNNTLDCLEDLLQNLINYHDSYINLKSAASNIRRFHFEDQEKYIESVKNADRREMILHNTFIDAVNILSRRMKEMGLDNSWRGDEKIYSPNSDSEIMRTKLKLWMLEIFGEKI